MGRPKKSATLVKEESTEQLEQEEQLEQVAADNILICNSKKTFGFVFKRGYVELYERVLFKEDTTVTAGPRTVSYKAGEFSPWRLSARPYPASWEHAVKYVADWVAQDSLTEKEDFNCIVEVITESRADVVSALKDSISGYLTKVVPQAK